MLDIFLSKAQMIQALNATGKAVPTRTTLPILECFLLEARNGRISLMANDMEMAIKTQLSGTIIEEGKIALDSKIFTDIIRKMPEDEIHIKVESSLNVNISAGVSVQNMPGKNGEDFIGMPTLDKGTPIVISQMSLKSIIEKTIFSTAPNDNNKMMTGELFEIKNNVLRVVAVDGYRIAIRYCVLNEYYEDKSVIVPGKSLNDISRIISGDMDKNVEIYLGKNHILFSFEDTTLVSRLIDGEYFRIDQMISENYETKLSLNRKDFLAAIDRSMTFVRESDKKPVILDIKEQGVVLSLTSNIGSMTERIEAGKEGSDLMIGFNPRFLIDALKAIEDETVNLYLTNSRAPGFLRDEEGTYIYLILPVNFVTR